MNRNISTIFITLYKTIIAATYRSIKYVIMTHSSHMLDYFKFISTIVLIFDCKSILASEMKYIKELLITSLLSL